MAKKSLLTEELIIKLNILIMVVIGLLYTFLSHGPESIAEDRWRLGKFYTEILFATVIINSLILNIFIFFEGRKK